MDGAIQRDANQTAPIARQTEDVKPKLMVIANAGMRASKRVEVDSAVTTLRRQVRSIDVVSTACADEATAAADRAVADGVYAIIAAGGDGTVHSVLQAVAGTSTALGIIAAGTGNDIAGALFPNGLSYDFASVRTIDAVRCDNNWFVGVASIGFDARVNERANAMHRLKGRLKYDVAMLAELARLKSDRFVVSLDGVTQEIDATFIAVANTSTYGGGMHIAPGAQANDGLLDVVVVGKVTRRHLLSVFPRVYRGTHVSHRAVSTLRCKTFVVESDSGMSYADGEPFVRTPAQFECVPEALHLLY